MTDDRDSSSDAVDEVNELLPVSTELRPAEIPECDQAVSDRGEDVGQSESLTGELNELAPVSTELLPVQERVECEVHSEGGVDDR